jgi:ABC-type uncharacterized transport system involved in gliding motility auxiliary subunit
MAVPAESVSLMPDPLALIDSYKPGGTPLTIAARVHGDARSAFPDGPPPPPPAKDKGDKAQDKKGTPGAKAPEKKGDAAPAEQAAAEKAPAPEPAKVPPEGHVASGKVNVIIVADTDFLHDQFWLDVRELLGQQVALPNAHNGTFVLSALENLTGSDALISLRARGVADRPFELVDDLRRDAEKRFLSSERALTSKLKDLRTKLASVQTEGDGENLVLTDKERQEIEKFRADLVETQRELRHVKRELRRDIDQLDGVLKFFNIAAVPLLIGLVSVGWAYRRRRAPGVQAQAAETTHDA